MIEVFKRVKSEFSEHVPALGKLLMDTTSRYLDPRNLPSTDTSFLLDVSSTMMDTFREAAVNPSKAFTDNVALAQGYVKLSQNVAARLFGRHPEPVIKPDKSDHRFDDQAWERNPLYYAVRQTYLLNAHYLQQMVDDLEGLSEHNHRQLSFLTRQFINAMAPTNFFLTNPEAVRRCRETWGLSLVRGLENFLEDMRRSRQMLNVSMTDTGAFRVGENVAVTPGKVVYQNDLFQLIQYQPTTETVHQRPLLVVPPFINKYYIMDLTEEDSMMRWLVAQGHTVFMMSWVNPDASYAGTTFSDYVTQGVLEAMDAVEAATGEREMNAIGYCVGGTLLATTLAHLKKKGEDERIRSATFLATLLDFKDPGEIGIYINESIVQAMESYIDRLGYYDGRLVAFSFSTLKENNLIWSFFVNNYLKGQDPLPFDLLYWNSDSTNLPAAMYKFYLREMYMNNRLKEPNALEIAGTPIDLSSIDTPSMFVSAIKDHIAVWKSTYAGYRLPQGRKHFVLGESGHVAGIINPPHADKYGYYLNDTEAQEPEAWFEEAHRHPGSWWPHWQAWVSEFQGDEVAQRIPGDGALDVIEDAPGSYVKRRIV
ncbi:class I poly(R)-hydroxyalkanoic acid synthase [Salicola sp. Rm-C-2C1-2]|uniref:class I poly(R)-hydroxyalkanoic acid synthase n=1 Tax=Salicola sp. Rm-C-2C1-2 TaxID=3141321 RepID=UPI0032E4A8DC